MNPEAEKAPGPDWTDELLPMEERRRLLDQALAAVAAAHSKQGGQPVRPGRADAGVPVEPSAASDKPSR